MQLANNLLRGDMFHITSMIQQSSSLIDINLANNGIDGAGAMDLATVLYGNQVPSLPPIEVSVIVCRY